MSKKFEEYDAHARELFQEGIARFTEELAVTNFDDVVNKMRAPKFAEKPGRFAQLRFLAGLSKNPLYSPIVFAPDVDPLEEGDFMYVIDQGPTKPARLVVQSGFLDAAGCHMKDEPRVAAEAWNGKLTFFPLDGKSYAAADLPEEDSWHTSELAVDSLQAIKNVLDAGGIPGQVYPVPPFDTRQS